MEEFYFGAHIDSNNLIDSAIEVKKSNGNLVQIFLTRIGEKNTTERSIKELDEFKAYLKENKMKVVVHSSYMHNTARNWDPYSWWLKNLELEIKYAHYIEAIGLVLHFGKKLELSLEEAYNNMYTSLIYVHNKTKAYKDVPILLETPTGQGSEVCYKMEDLAYFFKKFSKHKEFSKRFKLCVDTCHIFSAGYNLKTKNDVKRYLEIFEELIGIRHIKLIHLNDCKVDVGAQRDRHDNIGKGYIGMEGLSLFFKYFKKLNVPIILETPDNGYRLEIDILSQL
jgi:deoxyribonuclease IV